MRTVGLIVAGLLFSVLAAIWLAGTMVRPIRTLQDGAARIGEGDLEQQIDVKTGDELQGTGRAVQPHDRAAARVLRRAGAQGR
jgi:nitrogen fixation/metabolism regulation signal transduction histidine kinase